MKSKVVVEVDVIKDNCGDCLYMNIDGAFCKLFQRQLRRSDSDLKRCLQCLANETKNQ